MNLSFLHQRSYKLLLGLMLAFVIFLSSIGDITGQVFNRPRIPILSLVGGQNDQYNTNWYPDGFLQMAPSDNMKTYEDAREFGKEFLMPVFIDNKWTKYPGPGETDDGITGSAKGNMYVPDPIHSFTFKIQYDSSVLRAVGVEKLHPYEDPDNQKFQNVDGQYYEPLAKDFAIEWHDYKDTSFRWFIYGDEPIGTEGDKRKGRTIKITGTSNEPLPRCHLASDDFRVLLYVKFRVVDRGGQRTAKPIYISNDTILYNDMNVCMDRPFIKYLAIPEYATYNSDYPPVTNTIRKARYFQSNTGLGGIVNYDVTTGVALGLPTSQIGYRPGVIWMKLFQQSPGFGFYCPEGFISYPLVQDPDNPAEYRLTEPVTVDFMSNRDNPATRTVFLRNSLAKSRLMDITIESDQTWLKFRTIPKPTNQNPIPMPTRKGFINFIDFGILGPFDDLDPLDNKTTDDGDVELQIQCDPIQLPHVPTDSNGIYVGYLTFKSPYADVNPVRLKVTFIYFAVPNEWYNQIHDPGITVTVFNSRGVDPSNPAVKPGPDSTKLIFGTGPRASEFVDTLYGEFAQPSPFPSTPTEIGQGRAWARWFPPTSEVHGKWKADPNKITPADEARLLTNGYGDFAPNAWFPRSGSRDIRDTNDKNQSLLFWCKFVTFHPSYYPIRIQWDVQDFPENASLFLRDVYNGEKFNVDMRKSTLVEGTKYSYVIDDPKFTSFLIEYTPARVIEYLDPDGTPRIKKGWNLLSLAVRPVNTIWDVFFKNAINVPYFFSQNQYQYREKLTPGVGYFVKYGEMIDTKFAGAFINEIRYLSGDPVKLYPGWNTIGALSVPSTIMDIEFDPYMSLPIPARNFTRKNGLWGYKTNVGYSEVTVLEPGLGYWIKVGIDNDPVNSEMATGYYRLTAPINRIISFDVVNERQDILAKSTKVVVSDNAQNVGSVYMTNNTNVDLNNFEMPPVPPTEMFDIRHSNNTILTNTDNSVIVMQGITYPLSISVENAEADYTFVDAVTGEVLGTIKKGTNNNIEISKLAGNSVRVLESEVAGLSVYPNPVNLISAIDYTITENGLVSVKLYDILGNEVSSIVNNEYRKAGSYQTEINANSLTNGTYIIKVITGTKSYSSKVTVVK